MASSSLKVYCPLGRGPGMRSFSRSASGDRLPPFGSSACGLRGFSAGASVEEDYSQEVDEINLKFAEAREEIDAALESKDTVYFNEEADCAREAVKEVLDLFDGLLAKLPEKNRGVLRRSMGLKMEQLKAELEQLKD
ncbi:unnamed protein product [Spirodela intermedia]|nr:unnamed protein product [Spirodela intermedia]CAA6666229.1 unnamed protein product [Spirodela intermedia]